MISSAFNAVLYQPLYNGLVFLTSIVPFGDVGIAIIVLTLIVKFAISPLTHKSTKTQVRLRSLEPEIERVKAEHKDDKQKQSERVMELYRQHGVNPFSGCLLFIIQLPILIALYWTFWKGLANGGFDSSVLYSFVSAPDTVNMNFLGLIDMSGKSVVLALLAGLSQYVQVKLSSPLPSAAPRTGGPLSLKEEFARSMQIQMRYGLPIFVAVISYTISAAVALYWTTSNLFTIIHEFIVRYRAEQITKSPPKED
ncbi:MAG: membrane protein insertase YidC [Parcubacteria group bacterium]|nr:membrane protein insertase YidC [Parcubacteria group bacterium]